MIFKLPIQDKDILYVVHYYGKIPTMEICKHLERTWNSILVIFSEYATVEQKLSISWITVNRKRTTSEIEEWKNVNGVVPVIFKTREGIWKAQDVLDWTKLNVLDGFEKTLIIKEGNARVMGEYVARVKRKKNGSAVPLQIIKVPNEEQMVEIKEQFKNEMQNERFFVPLETEIKMEKIARNESKIKIPKEELEYIFANYGYYTAAEIAKKLGYIRRNGIADGGKVSSVIYNYTTDEQKIEFEKRFKDRGKRRALPFKAFSDSLKQSSDYIPTLVPVSENKSSKGSVLWGEIEDDYLFIKPKSKLSSGQKTYYQPKYTAQSLPSIEQEDLEEQD